jgi:hypothetical protein
VYSALDRLESFRKVADGEVVAEASATFAALPVMLRIVIRRPRTRRYTQGHGTQDLYRFGLPRWRSLRPVWGIKYGALRLVLG